MAQRHAANGAIISVSLFLAVWNIDTHQEVSGCWHRLRPLEPVCKDHSPAQESRLSCFFSSV